MKTCVFVIGGNCTGKTTLAKKLAEYSGGFCQYKENYTTSKSGVFSFGGKYSNEMKHGGVDCIYTRYLPDAVKNALKESEVIICEGSYLDSFGLNLQKALFNAEKQLVVCLYADIETIKQRQSEREKNFGKLEKMIQKSKRCLTAVDKWKSIYVPVLKIDTKIYDKNKVFSIVLNAIKEISKIE